MKKYIYNYISFIKSKLRIRIKNISKSILKVFKLLNKFNIIIKLQIYNNIKYKIN